MTAGDDFNLTTTEQAAYDELRRRIGKDLDDSIHDGNRCFYRFLKARDFDVDKAETMLRNSLRWRRDFNVASIVKEYKVPEVLEQNFGKVQIGFDKEGSPLFYIPVGQLDVKGILMSVKDIDVDKMFVRFSEMAELTLKEQSKKLRKSVNSYSLILNIDGLSFATATDKKGVEVIIRLAQLQQDNYPERLKCLYMIHASGFFTIPFSIIKHFIASALLNKISIFGADGWKEELVKVVDENVLPAFLGGKKTDPDGDPLCKSFVNHGGKVDEKHYIHKSKRSLSSSPGVKKLVLARASFSEIILDVLEHNSLIEWEFETKTRDIGFGLFYKEMVDDEERLTELVSLQRLDTEEFAETGIYKCEKSGSYVMLFDNSYSWIRSKEIYYKARVITPKEHDARISEKTTY